MNESDFWRWLIEHVAIPLLGGAWGALAYWINLVSAKFNRLSERIGAMEIDIPKNYATKDDVAGHVANVGASLEKHMDTLRTDVQGLHTDVKDVLKILANRKP